MKEMCKAHANRHGSIYAPPLSLSGLPTCTIDWEKSATRVLYKIVPIRLYLKHLCSILHVAAKPVGRDSGSMRPRQQELVERLDSRMT